MPEYWDVRDKGMQAIVDAIDCPWDWCTAKAGERCLDGNGHHMNRIHSVRAYAVGAKRVAK